MRAALPIAEATAKEVGKGSAAEGATEIARRVADAPGLRLSKTARNVNRRLQTLGDLDESAMLSAGRSGQFVDLAPVRQAAADALAPGGRIHTQISSSATQRGAENVLRNTENRLFQGRPSLDPAEARAVLKNTEFVSGSPDVPGADAMVRTMRRALSEQYKTDVPGAASIFEEQHRLIPVQETLDRALFQGGSRPIQSAEVLISGGRPRMFGVVPLPRGATLGAGKTAYKMGKAAQAPVVPLTPGLLRALPFLTGTMRQVPSHESVR